MSNQTLPQYDVQELTETIATLLDESRAQVIQLLKLQKLLLEGDPLTPARIASSLLLSQAEVNTLLQGAELDQDGNVVGWGLSLVPTPHSYKTNNRQFYVWCAFDAIAFPIFHKANAIIESPDPISGDKVRLIGTPDGVRALEPDTAVVSLARGTLGLLENIRAKFCNFTHFFTSAQTASEYASKQPGLVILPVEEAFQIGKHIWEKEPYKSVIASL